MTYTVVILSRETSEVIKRIDVNSESAAERVEDGININLDHDKYYTEIW